MWHILFCGLCATLYLCDAHVDVRMVLVQPEENIYLDNYTAHSTFLNWIRNEAYARVSTGLAYGICQLKTDPKTSMHRMTPIKYTVLQLIHALASGDMAYSQLLLGITQKHNKTSAESLMAWIEFNFKFPDNDIYKALKSFVHWNEYLKSQPTNIVRLVLFLSEKYFIFDKAVAENDIPTAEWLIKQNITVFSPHSIEILWSRRNDELISKIIEITESWNSTYISKLFSNITHDRSFIEYIVENKCFKIISSVLELNDSPRCWILLSALGANITKIVNLVKSKHGFKNLRCSKNVSVSILHAAVNSRRWEVTEGLIGSGIDIDSLDSKGHTPLYKALCSGHVEAAKFLVQNGAVYNSTPENGRTLLSTAVVDGRTDVVQNLIDMGASPLAPDADGRISLQIAIMLNDSEITAKLLKNIPSAKSVDIDGMPLLHFAVLKSNSSIVRTLLELHFDANEVDERGVTAMMLAATMNDSTKLLYLAEHGGRVNAKDQNGNTALHVATQYNQLSAVRVLMVLGANVNDKNYRGKSALYIAVENNNHLLIPYLVLNGADVGLKTEDGGSLLHLASSRGSYEAFESVMNYNLSLNSTNNFNETPLFVAVKFNKSDLISLIVSKGGCIHEIINGNTLLHVAVEYNSIESMVALLKLGLSQNTLNDFGNSSLSNAILKNNYDLLKSMLENSGTLYFDADNIILASSRGCIEALKAMKYIWGMYGLDIHTPDRQTGRTPLSEAVKADQAESVKYLLENGANVNFLSNNGDDLVHLASMRGSIKVLPVLAKCGLNVDRFNRKGETPLWIATKKGHLDFIKLLFEYGADSGVRSRHGPWEGGSLMFPAAFSGAEESVLYLLSIGLDVNDEDILGETPLHISTRRGLENLVVTLLDEGADVDNTDIIGEAALHRAVYDGRNDLAKTLVAYGADLNPRTLLGLTPLHHAAMLGHMEMVKFLVESGADRDVEDVNGWTPVHWGAYKGHTSVVGELLTLGFNATAKNNDGLTPEHLANLRNHMEIVKIINVFSKS